MRRPAAHRTRICRSGGPDPRVRPWRCAGHRHGPVLRPRPTAGSVGVLLGDPFLSCIGERVLPLARSVVGSFDQALLFEAGERGVDGAGAGPPVPAGSLFELGDDLVAVHRPFGQQHEHAPACGASTGSFPTAATSWSAPVRSGSSAVSFLGSVHSAPSLSVATRPTALPCPRSIVMFFGFFVAVDVRGHGPDAFLSSFTESLSGTTIITIYRDRLFRNVAIVWIRRAPRVCSSRLRESPRKRLDP